MAMDKVQGRFGIHSVCLYNRSTRMPIVMVKVLGECNLDFSAEFEKLMGGSQMYAFDAAVKEIKGEVSISGREYPAALMNQMLGGSLTQNESSTSGKIEGFANGYGTTIYNETNGVDAIELTSGDSADLKEGKYVLIATDTQELSLYGLTDADFKEGTDLTFEDDALLIEDEIDCSSTDVEIEELGITLSLVGTPAFTVGHTAEFYIRKVNTVIETIDFGQDGASFTEFGLLLAGAKKADGSVETLELYNCRGAGFPIGYSEKGWAEWSITCEALYDSSKDKVGTWRRTLVTTS